ncbi:TPA: IMP dehydrogenase [candidate division WOR-3 bacterium]|jgi:IMP dehydrogenase|uniref:Inosine-5'-monophosphate dehydrogenase n=1 Tax=candidate division WOR-3 bacterium TaxID=2052148 RepID=A0A350HAR1_UNCW3|nr:IMP dehydrogenase [candidate division WOR-3 bacterium]
MEVSMKEGLTFDDVLLVPQHSETVAKDVVLKTMLTKNISLNIPILSSAMDTVTDHRMAIAMAKEGGMGIIHKNMSIEQQAEEVKKVKRYESGMIQEPLRLYPDETLKHAKNLMDEFHVSGLPVVDKDNKLIGILTKRDILFENDYKIKVKERMTSKKLITAKKGINLKKAREIFREERVEKLPIVDENYCLVGLITIRDILNIEEHPNACKDKIGRLRVGAAVGVSKDFLERSEALYKAGVDVLTVDTAHGDSLNVLKAVKELKKRFDLDIIGGNIATAKAAESLLKAGADSIKVGIGPGSICTTRIIAGIGVPQLTAIMEVSQVAKKYGIPFIADGGIVYSGDIVKALAAGASSVMMGGLLAGTEEAPGETLIMDGRKFKVYRGMGSVDAMMAGSKDRYFQEDAQKLVPEGIVARVPYKGSVSEVIFQLVGGIKSGMGYCGAKNIKELQKNAEFIKITHSGVRESHPHNVIISKESPNYEMPK